MVSGAVREDEGVADRVVLVTGGSGSIGREIAACAAADGWVTLVHGRTEASAGAAVAALRGRVPDGRLHAIAGDFLEDGVLRAMMPRIRDEFGRLDAIINCAASAPAGVVGPFAQTDPAAYTALCHHAITQLQWLCHAAFPVMAGGGGGAVVAVASDAGLFAAPNQSLIGPTRAAIMNFCRNVALEAAHDGIRVNCVSTSYVEDTALFDAMMAKGSRRPETARRRAGLGLPRPQDIADLCLFLIGPGSKRLTGQIISVNGGLNA